ncbi:uncharacterized protein LOC119090473 [Pollicipes pollicipes]|uniref:uncharacterized protein LOC119090473 n=1 Tax=Pollicipes pollicipes TaxID=41117 RepID=UPI001885804D|nr:uncharacterized protein LOC119090473 [Pollicipes pollicipes]
MVVSEGLPIPESFRPMAVWPGHNITDGIRSGELTVEEVRDSLPDVQVALVGATGAGVTALFARAVSDLTKDGQATQAFLQVAGVRVIYDLDLPAPFRPKYLMNLCLTCPEQRYMAISPEWNYTIAVPATLLKDSAWADVTSQFFDIRVTDFTARDAVALMVNRTGRLLAPVGDRIRFTHINPDAEGGGDTFVTVLVTIVICMIVFGLAIFGFIAWSRRYSRHGSSIGLVR